MEKMKKWIKAAGIRALKTAAQSALAAMGTTAAFNTVHWPTVLSVAASAAFLSVLTSLAGLPEVETAGGCDV